jgi:hypothetical protein
MENPQMQDTLRDLTEQNQRMLVAMEDIRRAIDPFLGESTAKNESPERRLVHDVRNIVNELSLLRSLAETDEQA